MRNVRFDIPGVVAIGPYLPGRVYRVDDDEAERLITTKGFVETTEPTAEEQVSSSSEDDGR